MPTPKPTTIVITASELRADFPRIWPESIARNINVLITANTKPVVFFKPLSDTQAEKLETANPYELVSSKELQMKFRASRARIRRAGGQAAIYNSRPYGHGTFMLGLAYLVEPKHLGDLREAMRYGKLFKIPQIMQAV